MKKRIITLSIALFSMGLLNVIYSQIPGTLNWYNGKAGMNTEKAYKSLAKRKSTTVVVAVIDSGIDIEHEDLKGKIWTNPNEIAGNGIDDDKNGYIDDIHGWNYLGGPNGKNQQYARLEKTRLFAKLEPRFKGVESGKVSSADKADFDLYKKLEKEIENEKKDTEGNLAQYEQLSLMIPTITQALTEKLGANFTVEDVDKWKPTDPQELQMKQIGRYIASGDLNEEAIKEALASMKASSEFQLNAAYNDREFIGDNPDDFNDTKYGNNDVEGPDALHGTHVGGIIGAIRGNTLGGDGVCENVKLMSIRTVPDGDEQDKDVALAIRYAVDNGAQVINMSFGKGYSAHPKEVYEAFLYAELKGVLLVQAAGNSAEDIDTAPNFPTNHYEFQTKKLTNHLMIGASTRNSKEKLAAVFSNYGQTSVDVFAPGFEIYNSVPQSDYKNLQGTSMASPMVAGVAALLKSYFPTLTMVEIREVILSSAKSYKGTMQTKPGAENLVDFGTLSTTGGVVDVSAAVKACTAKEKSKK